MTGKDYKFFHFILSRIDLYKKEYGKLVIPGEDFLIDFPTKSIHSTTKIGEHFMSWMKDVDQKTREDFKITAKFTGRLE